MLAQQIANYRRSYQKFDDLLPDGQRLVPLIESTRARSPALNEELSKEPK
jgi:hypothetical protein